MQTNGQTRKHSADERSVREKEKSQSSRAGFHRGLDSASVRKEALKGQSSFASATGCFVKGAAGSLSPGSAGCGQLPCPRRSKRKAVSSLQSPSCMPREEQGRGKTRAKIGRAGWQLMPLLKSCLGSDRPEPLQSSGSVTFIKRALKIKTSLSEIMYYTNRGFWKHTGETRGNF